MDRGLFPELATRTFDADAALSAALAEFQKEPREALLVAEARRAADHGFAWFARPSEVGHFQVVVRHRDGAEISADGQSISALLAGLLGHPLAHDAAPLAAQACEPEQEAITPGPEPRAKASPAQIAKMLDHARGDALSAQAAAEPEPRDLAMEAFNADPAFASFNCIPETPARSPAQLAAESLAEATGGAVVAEAVPDPDETERERLAVPLTDEQKQVCIEMISSLSGQKQHSFKIAFRDAFRVPREAKSIARLITEVRHMEFCDHWSVEAAGKVAP